MNISTNKLQAIRYCYQSSDNIYCDDMSNKAYLIKQLSLLLLIVTTITALSFIDKKDIYLIIISLLSVFIIKRLMSKNNSQGIDLNQVEKYLLSLKYIEQVISIELYHVNPEMKAICAKLKVSNANILILNALNKKIKSNLSQKFGITESVITFQNSIEDKIHLQNKTTSNCNTMLNNFHPLEFKYERYLHFKQQASQDFN